MNEFLHIDYKQPIGKLEKDMRTTTYIGHKHIDDTRLGNKLHYKFMDKKLYEEDPYLAITRKSDYQTNYVWKVLNLK